MLSSCGDACRLNHFKIIDYGLADFTEHYPSGRVDVGGPTHAVPKTGPLHFSIGKLEMSLPMPLSLEQLKGLPKVFYITLEWSHCQKSIDFNCAQWHAWQYGTWTAVMCEWKHYNECHSLEAPRMHCCTRMLCHSEEALTVHCCCR